MVTHSTPSSFEAEYLRLCSSWKKKSYYSGMMGIKEAFGFDADEALGVVAQTLEASGHLSWTTPLFDGVSLFTTLLTRGLFPEGLLEDLIKRHGSSLLTHTDTQGLPAYQAYWYALDKKGVVRPEKQDGVTIIAHLPSSCLSWLDAEGGSPGSGWLYQALEKKDLSYVDALSQRKVSFAGTHEGIPLAHHFFHASHWERFLRDGGQPLSKDSSSGLSAVPLWESLVRRNKGDGRLADAIIDWATSSQVEGVDLVEYWHRLRTLPVSDLSDYLMSRSDWKSLRDHRGYPALWVAAFRNPPLWRLVAEKKTDKEGILTARDNQGKSLWYYLFRFARNSTFTAKLVSSLERHAPLDKYAVDVQGRGLLAQWIFSKNSVSWFPNDGYGNPTPLFNLLSSSRLPLWTIASKEDETKMAHRLIDNPTLASMDWVEWVSRQQSQAVNPDHLLPELQTTSSEIRMGMMLVLALSHLSDEVRNPATHNSRLSSKVKLMKMLEKAGVSWPLSATLDSWIKASLRVLEKDRYGNDIKQCSPLVIQLRAQLQERFEAYSNPPSPSRVPRP